MRWIDDIIKVIEEHPHISPVHKEVLITRIEQWPTALELIEAHKVYEDKQSRTVVPEYPVKWS